MNSEIEVQLQKIADQQRDSWNTHSAGWKKWDDLFMTFLAPMGEEMIRQLQLKPGDKVLDLASGTGEPGLSIASKPGVSGVTITDLSENMLDIARSNAKKRGLKNIRTLVADVSKLPFEDNTFDAITCRLGFMFFPDMKQAANEIFRVLKPGGRFTTSVWNHPEKNYWVTAIMSSINKNLNLPPMPEGAPGVFRCAKKGLMMDLLEFAGFCNVSQKEIHENLQCGTAAVYWDVMTELAAPVAEALNKADLAIRQKIKTEVFGSLKEKFPDGNVSIATSALVIYGEKKI